MAENRELIQKRGLIGVAEFFLLIEGRASNGESGNSDSLMFMIRQ
jgi:hypothetical protein